LIPAVLALLLACDAEPPAPQEPTISPEEAEAAAEALLAQQVASEPAPADPGGEAPPDAAPAGAQVAELAQVVLVWEGIGPLYKNFFSTPDAVTVLAEGLGPHLADPVDVTIRYNTEDSVGDIFVRLRPDQLKRPVSTSGDEIALQDLAPITTALAAYRSQIAAQFDFRVESFRVSLESYRGARVCQLVLAGQPPPDGRLISPCVMVNNQKQCGQPKASGVSFPPGVAADVRACLDR